MKLNNKGITTVEVLICFVLIVIITTSIYLTVSNFNEKKVLEGYREKIINYKNIVTKTIQDDLIKVGLTHARIERTTEDEKRITTVYFDLKDGTKRELVVEELQAVSTRHSGGSLEHDDYYMIKYGKPGDVIEMDLPDVGHSGYNGVDGGICDVDLPARDPDCREIKDFSINNVLVSITDDNVISIYIGFYHPDFGTRYAINIVCPIDYASNGYDSTSEWKEAGI